jgi:hypothetical protein
VGAIVTQLLQGVSEYGEGIGEGIGDETSMLLQGVHMQTRIIGIDGQWEDEEIELSGMIDMVVFPTVSTPAEYCECIYLNEDCALIQQTSFRRNIAQR